MSNLSGTKSKTKIEQNPQGINISSRWFGVIGFVLIIGGAIFGVGGSLLLYAYYAEDLRLLVAGELEIIQVIFLVIVLVPAIFVAYGYLALYVGLCILFNSTKVKARRDGLEVTHGPLPLLRKQRIERAEITQIYVQVSDTAQALGSEQVIKFYHICFVDNTNHIRPLIGVPLWILPITLPHVRLEEALAVEKTLEDFYNIKDRRVFEEAKKEGQQAQEQEPLIVPTPIGLIMENDGAGGFSIRKKWKNPISGIFVIIAAIAFAGPTLFIAGNMLPLMFSEKAAETAPFFIFVMIFVLVGLVALFIGFQFLLNKTTLYIQPGGLVQKIKPLSLSRPKTIKAEDIVLAEMRLIERRAQRDFQNIYFVQIRCIDSSSLHLLLPAYRSSFTEEEVVFVSKKINDYYRLKK